MAGFPRGCGAPQSNVNLRQQPVNLAHLQCPIMMLKNPYKNQDNSTPSTPDASLQKNLNVTVTRTDIAGVLDRDVPCRPDNVGQYPGVGAVQCRQDNVGQYPGDVSCRQDNAGQYPGVGAVQCRQDNVGQYTGVGDVSCRQDNVGQYPVVGTVQCRQDNVGQYPVLGAVQCRQDNVGQYTGVDALTGGHECALVNQLQDYQTERNCQCDPSGTVVDVQDYNGVDHRFFHGDVRDTPPPVNHNTHHPFEHRQHIPGSEPSQCNVNRAQFMPSCPQNVYTQMQSHIPTHPHTFTQFHGNTHIQRQSASSNGHFSSTSNHPQSVYCPISHGGHQESPHNHHGHTEQYLFCEGNSPPHGRSYDTPGHHPGPESRNNVSIHGDEMVKIASNLEPGRIIQVCGPPMIGKATTVRQAISWAAHEHLIQHHIHCKTASTFQDFLNIICQNMGLQNLNGSQLNEDSVLRIINTILHQSQHCHHVLVLYKCENLRESPHGNQFLNFLSRIVAELSAVPVTVVFTTYKYYWMPNNGRNILVNIGMLSQNDIITLLHYYAPGIDVVSYSHVLAKTFCFPDAIRLIVEEFIADEKCRVTPETLEKKINKDHDFLSQLFESRLAEVPVWVSKKCLNFLTHFGHSVENSFTEAHLQYVNSSDLSEMDVNKFTQLLKQNHVVRQLPTINRLVIHPLVVYYLMMSSSQEKQILPDKWFDVSCNRYTYFLGRILMSAEASMQEHGRKGLVYGGLYEEWPNVRYVIQMALHCNRNTYRTFIDVAVSASGFIFKFFPREAESFYWGLYSSARDFGTPCEFAIMEAMLGHAIAEGSGIDTGRDYARADNHLTSAIQLLSVYGNSFFLGWALLRKGISLHRQGKYQESLDTFSQARNVFRNVNRFALGDTFSVSEARIEEEMITQEIHESIPYIFTGRNQLARNRLDHILDLIQSTFENHPELATLLNLIGLTEQRGNKNLVGALRWYKLSYQERTYFAKMCPETLLAVLNNIGMALFHQGGTVECIKYLEKALDIRRQCGWTHYYTALTLVHLAEIKMRIGNFPEAFKRCLEADRIFSATVKDHDMRLRVNFDLAHIRVALRQSMEGRNVGEGCGREIEGGDHHFGATSSQNHPNNRPQENVSDPGYVCVTLTAIEPCDLQTSAEEFLERLFNIDANLKGTHSDDGLSSVLCALEHAIILNLGDIVKFEKYRNNFLQFTREYPWLGETGNRSGAGVDSHYRSLIKHKELYLYILNTSYTDFNMITYIQLMRQACLTCMYANNIFTDQLWSVEAVHCAQRRQINGRLRRLDLMRDTVESDNGRPQDNMSSSPSEDSFPRHNNPRRDSNGTEGGARSDSSFHRSASHGPMSNARLENEQPIYGHRDEDISVGSRPHGDNYHDQVFRYPDISQSPESRIVKVQKDILSKIQGKQTSFLPSAHTPEVDLHNFPEVMKNNSKIPSDTSIRPQSLSGPRQPVEQSCTSYPSWNSSGSLQEQTERELHEIFHGGYRSHHTPAGEPLLGLGGREQSRDQLYTESHERHTGTAHSGSILQSNSHKFQLVQSECRSGSISGCSNESNPIYQLGTSEGQTNFRQEQLSSHIYQNRNGVNAQIDQSETQTSERNLDKPWFNVLDLIQESGQQPYESQTNCSHNETCTTSGQDKFSPLGYLSRNGFNSSIDQSETQTCGQHADKHWFNILDLIQQSVEQPYERHDSSEEEVKVCISDVVHEIDVGEYLPATGVDVPVCTQRLPSLAKSCSENDSPFDSQHPECIVHELVSEGQTIPEQETSFQNTKSPNDSQSTADSGHDSIIGMRLSGRTSQGRSSSESSNVSHRSSCSGGRIHPVGALPLESGYSSHVTGSRTRTCSVTDRLPCNPTTRLPRKDEKRNQEHGFSEIPHNVTDRFQEESAKTCSLEHQQNHAEGTAVSQCDAGWHRIYECSGPPPLAGGQDSNDQPTGLSPLRSDFYVCMETKNDSLLFQNALEQSRTDTLIPDEVTSSHYQSKTDHTVSTNVMT